MNISKIKSRAFNEILYQEIIDSTNNWAKRYYLEHECKTNKIFIAETQSNGKGRLGRHWSSHKGQQINMSLLLNSSVDANKLQLICVCAALAVNSAVIKLTRLKSKIKWPNDIIINNRKVCGILCESIFQANNIAVIIGIGINVKNKIFPKDIKNKATSILLEFEKKVSRVDLINAILEEFCFYYNKLTSSAIDEIISEYKAYCISIGKDVILNLKEQQTHAKAIDINSAGELIVKLDSGIIKSINHGEIVHQNIYESEDKSYEKSEYF